MKHTLSTRQTMDAWLGWFSIGARVAYAAICGPFRGTSGADTYHHHLIQAAVKALTRRFTPLQLQYLFKTYDQLYIESCKRPGIEPSIVSNDRGLRGFWIGNPTTAKYVVVQFHGGGFAMDATSAYLDFYPNIAKALSDQGITTAWLNIAYTLTPDATYPTQFREAVEALRYVVEDVGRSPRDIILVGDSAGGNLCLALLSQIAHPSPEAPKLAITEPLKALVCLSPWVSFRHNWPSMEENEYKDIDSKDVTDRWARGYLNGQPTNYYVEPCDAPETWWDGARVEQTLVLAGGDEMLLDPIRSWVAKFSKLNPDTTLVVGQDECHIAPLIWPLLGDRHETQQGAALKSWLLERLHV